MAMHMGESQPVTMLLATSTLGHAAHGGLLEALHEQC